MDDLKYAVVEVPETDFDGHDWNVLLAAYQLNQSASTSEPLLAALERPARRFCASLPAIPPVLCTDDLWQEFQLTLLEEARRMKPQEAPHWTAIRLLQRAHSAVWVALLREDRIRTIPLSENIPAQVDVEAEALEAIEMDERDPLYRKYVLGESYDVQARRLGVSAATVRQRAARRREQLRAEHPEFAG